MAVPLGRLRTRGRATLLGLVWQQNVPAERLGDVLFQQLSFGELTPGGGIADRFEQQAQSVMAQNKIRAQSDGSPERSYRVLRSSHSTQYHALIVSGHEERGVGYQRFREGL